MSLLSIKERQKYLKELGFYTGEIDGKVGKLTRNAYKGLQNKYFTRKKDKDGYYGTNTDTLLRNVYKCKDLPNFKVTEFRCKCNGLCTGYPSVLSDDLLTYLQDLRTKKGVSCTIVSGMRCNNHNKKVGGSTNSRHLNGKAVDVRFAGMTSLEFRKEIIDNWINNYANTRYGYCDDYSNLQGKRAYKNYPSMGNSTHLDVM